MLYIWPVLRTRELVVRLEALAVQHDVQRAIPKARAIACERGKSHRELGVRSPPSLVALRRSSKARHVARMPFAQAVRIHDVLDDGASQRRGHHFVFNTSLSA